MIKHAALGMANEDVRCLMLFIIKNVDNVFSENAVTENVERVR